MSSDLCTNKLSLTSNSYERTEMFLDPEVKTNKSTKKQHNNAHKNKHFKHTNNNLK